VDALARALHVALAAPVNTPPVIVVGGGPAGALAARALAARGRRVLLLEARTEIDDKVCGGCLHPRAVHALEHAGLGGLLDAALAPRLDTLELHRGAHRARLHVPLGRALSRRTLDRALLAAADDAGVDVRLGQRVLRVEARDDGVTLHVRDAAGRERVEHGALALLAHGLGALPLRIGDGDADDVHARASTSRRLGAGAILEAPAVGPPTGELRMHVGRAGYLGVVRLEDDRVDLAAAFSREALTRASTAGELAAELLDASDPALAEAARAAHWRGTPALARASSARAARALPLGDAAGSVEPFTGEGLARAFTQARDVVEHALAAADGDPRAAERWAAARARALRGSSRRVPWLARALRHPALVAGGVALAAHWPGAGQTLARWLHGSETHA